jgi:ABC-type protease/lipase transport system fused ATPase/permease subunit
MFDIRDLFQWERFITPSIIRVFFWLAFFVAFFAGVYGIVAAVQLLPFNPLGAFLLVILSILGACLAILTARLAAEYVLITFRMNDHLGAVRSRAEM